MKKVLTFLLSLAVSLVFTFNTSAQETGNTRENIYTLDQVIKMAIEANHRIHISEIEVEVSGEAKKEAFTEFLPKVRTEYGFTYYNEESQVTFDNHRYYIGQKDNYLWTTSAIQSIFTGLAVLTDYQIKGIELDIAEIKKAATRLDIFLEAKIGFFEVQNAKLLVEVAEKSVKSLKDHLSVATEYYEVGLTPKIDMLNSEVDLAISQQALERTKNRVTVKKAALNNIIDLPVDMPIDTAGTLEYIPFPFSYDDCVEKAIELRPGLKEAKKRINISKKKIRLARSDYYPNITAGINYNRAGDHWYVGGSDSEDRENWNVMAHATWTLWEWGKTHHAVLKSEKNLQKVVKELAIVEDQIRFEVKKAYNDMKTAQHNIKVAEKSVASADENLRISQERYKEQVAIITEVLDADTRLTKARTTLTNALNQYNVSMATLYWAIGME